MPKNLGLYNNDLSVPRKKDIDALTLRVDTNEDNIAMAESDIEGLQTDVGALKTDVGQVKTALNSKQDTVTGGASTITDDNLAANHALVSNGSGKVAVSEVTSTELGYLGGATSNVQTQINDKVSKAGDTMTGTLTVGSASLQTNGYVTGTWLKTTGDIALTTKPSQIAVINGGWIYSRTPEQIKDDIGLSNVDNVKQYSASNPPPYPVNSVNSKTGVVELTASDVGAIKRTGDSVRGTFEFGDMLGGATVITGSTPAGIHMYELAPDRFVSVIVPSDESENEVAFYGGSQMSGGIMTVGTEAVRLVNIGKPVKNTDAANKAYVDENKGVQILTQSAQPTAQGIGDFWFQEN